MADRRKPGTRRTRVGGNPFPTGSTGARQWERMFRNPRKLLSPYGAALRLAVNALYPDGSNNQVPSGYVLCCSDYDWDCPGGSVPLGVYEYRPTYGTQATPCAPPPPNCTTMAWPCALGHGGFPSVDAIPAGAGGRPAVITKFMRGQGAFPFRRPIEEWARIGGVGQPVPVPFVPVFEPMPQPVPEPDLEPGFLDPDPTASPQGWAGFYPPLKTEPIPYNIPYPDIPDRDDTRPVPGERNETSYGTRFRPVFEPVAREAWPQPQPLRQRHRLIPAGQGIKERKLIGNVEAGSITGRALSRVTEGADLVNCLHSGLPDWAKSRQGGAIGRAKAIYRHLDKIDVATALEACVREQIEDYFWGQIGKASARANRRLGLTGGTVGRTSGNIAGIGR